MCTNCGTRYSVALFVDPFSFQLPLLTPSTIFESFNTFTTVGLTFEQGYQLDLDMAAQWLLFAE